MNPLLVVVLATLAGAVMMLVQLVVFTRLRARRRVFTHGARGTALVVAVRPTALHERYSVVERPTERVVVATAAVPRGMLTDQKVPAGDYRPGEVVAVVQDPRDPHRVYLDRPELERSALAVLAPLLVVAVIPLVVVLGAARLLGLAG